MPGAIVINIAPHGCLRNQELVSLKMRLFVIYILCAVVQMRLNTHCSSLYCQGIINELVETQYLRERAGHMCL